VKLLKGGAVIATTTTDASGYYGFGNLDPSTAYTVQFVVPTGSTVTTKDAGGDSSNSRRPTSRTRMPRLTVFVTVRHHRHGCEQRGGDEG